MTLSPRHLVLAALLHLALFILLFTGVQCSKKIESPPVVQGVLINPSQIPHPQPPQPVAPPQVKPQEDQGPQPKVDAEEVAEQAKQEQKKQEEQEQKKEAAEAEKQKQLADQKQKEDQAIALKKQQDEEAQKKAQEQADAAKRADDLKKQAAQEEQERQAAALAEKQKAEAAKRQAEQRKAAAADLQQQLGMESAQLTAQMQSDWAVQLSAAIKRAWARPPGTDESLRAYLHITLSEGGQVQSARIVTSSGVPIFDESVKGAVYKASPLPLPRDPSAFDSNITICFSPNPQSCQQ